MGNQSRDSTEKWSWNEILTILGPLLISQVSEQQLKDQLTEVFRNRYQDRTHEVIYSCYPRDEDFQRTKVQLRAIGLIREVKVQNAVGRTGLAWTLTPYGDRLMTQVAAIRSSAKTGQTG